MDDADAFSELYRREGEPVLIFLTRRTWDGETALELTAETFAVALRAWRKLGVLGPEQQRVWLFTVARRQLARYLRRAKVERRALPLGSVDSCGIDSGKLPGGPGPRLYQRGIEAQVPQVRAPDPDGAAPWGFTATRDCSTAIGRIVAGRLASIDLSDGVLKAGSEISGSSSSCATHPEAFTPAAELDKPVEFEQQQVGAGENPFQGQPQRLRQPEIEWRTLPAAQSSPE
jgi:DNA-directed RNA polymerase specialized sigma24 family protein